MLVGADKAAAGMFMGEGNPYLTEVGKYLRKWGIDELPQLINIRRGEMSFVGSRPTCSIRLESIMIFRKIVCR